MIPLPAISFRQALLVAGGTAFLAVSIACWLGWSRADHWKGIATDCQSASKENAAAQAKQNAAVETQSKDNADVSDRIHKAELAAARTAVDEYIRTHRVQPKADSSPTPAPADDNSPGVPPEMPAAGVVVAEEDVRACSEAIEYAWAAYGWAATLNTPIAQAGD